MKELIINNMELFITIITMCITWLAGKISKKSKMPNKYIPVVNIIIMILSAGLYYWATGDISVVVASGSPIATLFYDTIHNLKKGE